MRWRRRNFGRLLQLTPCFAERPGSGWFRAASRIVLLSILLQGLSGVASAQLASLTRDVLPPHFEQASQPGGLVPWQSRLVFVAFSPSSQESGIFSTDGTFDGTELLAQTCGVEQLCDGGLLGVTSGFQLWLFGFFDTYWLVATDGTPGGTKRFASPVRAFSGSFDFASLGARAVFVGNLASGEPRLVVTDGAEPGTRVLSPAVGPAASPTSLASAGEVAFFTAFAAGGQRMTWRTDGTDGGTFPVAPAEGSTLLFGLPGRGVAFEQAGVLRRLRGLTTEGTAFDLASFEDAESPELRVWAGGAAIAFADDEGEADRLWITDGSTAGTFSLAPLPGRVRDAHWLGSRWFAEVVKPDRVHELWVVDAELRTSRMVFRLCRDCSGATMWSAGGRVVFEVDDGLWGSDGTPEGTVPLAPFVAGSTREEPEALLFVGRNDPAFSPQIFRTDGTPEGTRALTALESPYQLFSGLAVAGEDVYFRLDFGAVAGAELWRVSVHGGDASLVRDLVPFGQHGRPRQLAALPTGAAIATEGDLWSSDGTEEGTVIVADTRGCLPFGAATLLPVPGGVVFGCPHGADLAFSDGGAPRALDSTLAAVPYTVSAPGFVVLPQRTVFSALQVDIGVLAATDGTAAGTVVLAESAMLLGGANGHAFFTDSQFSGDLWRTDGTPEGTSRLTGWAGQQAVGWAFSSRAGSVVHTGSGIVFVARSLGFEELWILDDSAAGASRASGRVPGLGEIQVSPPLGVAGSTLVFFGAKQGRTSLWGVDLDAGALTELAPLAPEVYEPRLEGFVTSEDRVYFQGVDATGRSLFWVSDGTPGGTAPVTTAAGQPLHSPVDALAAGNRVFVSAETHPFGSELWQVREPGGPASLVHDLLPGAFGSRPERLTVAGDRLFFFADDGLHGREAFSMPLDDGPACRPDARATCLQDGRFRVEVAWTADGELGRGSAVPLSSDTGYFWFFDPANVETVVKVLDGRSLNDFFWVFYGALSNVHYFVTVTDAHTGAAKRYENPPGRFASVGDTGALADFGKSGVVTARGSLGRAADAARAIAPSTCVPSVQRLCLQGERFAVEVHWRDFSGGSGVGQAVQLTSDTGYFWFFDPANVEAVVKVLDARPINGARWVFYGALSNVEYRIVVTDTATGAVREYVNPAGRFASNGDTSAFPE